VSTSLPPDAIAIVGLAGRFPGAENVEALWEMLGAGREGLTPLSETELRAAGVSAAELDDPRYVRVAGSIAGHDCFDAAFFGLTPREAEVLDPQHRVFFECAWAALEDAAIDPTRFAGSVGVFGGASLNTYLLYNLISNPQLLGQVGVFGAAIANDKDALTQRLSYLLDLKGPAVTVQTACSTSLVAVQLACQSLQNFQCDLALAGGVSIKVPHRNGYWFTEGGVASPDGTCRPFDAEARGTVPASGCGVVALRRLEDALAEGDPVVAVIRGAAVNNDGAVKVGFTAPAVQGQADVIELALAAADVAPASIGFVEAHGTGTPLGDPIEVEALSKVFGRAQTDDGPCLLGAIKSNIGHLDAAAGVAGLIKAALAVQRGKVPGTVHYTAPNPAARLPESPFTVVAETTDWPRRNSPRRAGVSSFGIGGTNAHVVLEEAPARSGPGSPDGVDCWLPISARSAAALTRSCERLAAWLEAHPEVVLANVACTLQTGRRSFEHRRIVRAKTVAEAIAALRATTSSIEPDGPAAISEWVEGRQTHWPEAARTPGHRIRLPTYAFARDRYWVEPGPAAQPAESAVPAQPAAGLQFQRATWRVGRTPGGEGPGVVLDVTAMPSIEAMEAVRKLGLKSADPLVVVTNGVLPMASDEPDNATCGGVLGLMAVLRHEAPAAQVRFLDAGGLDPAERSLSARRELSAPADETVVALTAGKRWIRQWTDVPVAPIKTLPWRERGVYLITGGFGRLGRILAGELARACRARLVLVGRQGGAGAEEFVRELERTGGEVMAAAADVADAVAMERLLAEVEARWGALHGVIHAAGLTGSESVRELKSTDAAMLQTLWRAKVEGWRVLNRLTTDRSLDFRVAISSLVTVEGAPGLGAYAAANAALDCLVDRSADRADGGGWIGIAWGGTGAAAHLGEVAIDILGRLVTRREPGTWVVRVGATAAEVSPVKPPVESQAVSRAEAERRLATIWREAIGNDPASPDQNFFEAGGDSLAAVQIVARINQEFGIELSVAGFLDKPTVREVAAQVAPAASEPASGLTAPLRRGALRRQRRLGGGDA